MSGISEDKTERRRRVPSIKCRRVAMGEAWYGIGGDQGWCEEKSL
jgi:hypothetical protein